MSFLQFSVRSGLPHCTIEVMKLIIKVCSLTPASGRVPTTEQPLWTLITKSIIGFDIDKDELERLWILRNKTQKTTTNLETVMDIAANLQHLEGIID